MSKNPEIEEFLNQLSLSSFGRPRSTGYCVSCGSNKVYHSDFRDDLSRAEFRISRMCQVCQDSVFGEDE